MGERRVIKLQAQAYNVFNHTQFTGLTTAAVFNASGVQTNADFGRPSAAAPARILAFALRFEF